jgi:hypothetical protein
MARAHGAFANLNDNLVARYVEVLEQLRFDGFRQLLGQCCDLIDSIHFSLELFLQNVVYHGLCLLGFEALSELESEVRRMRDGTAKIKCDWLQKCNLAFSLTAAARQIMSALSCTLGHLW